MSITNRLIVNAHSHLSSSRMRKEMMANGFTLIEMVVYIVVIGIAITAVMVAMTTALLKTSTPNHQTIITQLAQERAELILGNRRLNGYPGTDICAGSPGLSPCSLSSWSGYTVTSTSTATTIGSDSSYTLYTITAADSSAINTLRLFLLVGKY